MALGLRRIGRSREIAAVSPPKGANQWIWQDFTTASLARQRRTDVRHGFGRPFPPSRRTPTIGFIYVGSRDDYGYNQAHAQGAAALKKMAGLKVVEEEKVAETDAVEKTMESMINLDGASLLFPTFVRLLQSAT